MTMEIRVNGRKFDLWETATVQRSIDNNAGMFQFSSSNTTPADYPVKAGDQVQVIVDGVAKVTGFADRVRGRGSDEGNEVSVSGRDNTCDLIDSSVPDSVKTITPPITMTDFCKRIVSALGANIEVRNVIGNAINVQGDEDDFGDVTISADSGQKCMDFLTSFARKQQVYLVTDGAGRLLVYRPGNVRSSTQILHERGSNNNNVKNYSVSFEHQERFGVYRTTSQDDFSFSDSYGDESTSRFGEAQDGVIRASRYLEFQGEESMTNEESRNRAVEELNVRKARSTVYTPTLATFSQEDGTVWDFGQLVSVKDDFAGMRGILLIRSVEYTLDKDSGSRCVLTLADPSSYNVKVTDVRDKRRSSQGDNLQRQTPDIRVRSFR